MRFRYPTAKLRFVEKPPRNEEWRALHRAAERRTRDAEQAFIRAVRDLRRATTLAGIQAALERGAPEIAAAEFPWHVLERSLEDRLLPILTEVARRGAVVAVEGLQHQLRRRFEVRKQEPPSFVTGFDLVNPSVITELSLHGAELVTLITNETRSAIQQIVLAAQQQGLDVREQARRIASVLRQSAGLNAQQARALANFEASLREAGRSASDIRSMIATRRDKMIGQRARLIAQHECLTAETLVDRAVVRAVYRRWYTGDLVEVVTSRGRKLSATPNHPMLTRRGWVAAALLNPSDELICDGREKDASASGDPHVIADPTPIAEVFDAVAAIGIRERRVSGQPDFHGDGRDGYVDIARAGRVLRVGNFATLRKPCLDLFLSPSYMVRASFCDCERLLATNQPLCVCQAPPSDPLFLQDAEYWARGNTQVSRYVKNAAAALVAPHNLGDWQVEVGIVRPLALEAELGGFCSGASDARGSNDTIHPLNADTHFLGDEQEAEPRFIELDRVQSVRVREFSGHVYNIASPYGYFNAANGVYTGNTLSAANVGQQDIWRQATNQGLLEPDQKRKWLTQGTLNPDNPCRICAPMNGQIRGLNEAFVSPYNGAERLHPPIHARCRCVTLLVFPD